MHIRVTISLNPDVLQKFDRSIGDVKRSTAINRLMIEHIAEIESAQKVKL